jgi:hypothetical protein
MLRPCLCGYCDLEFHLCPLFSNFVGRLSRSVLHEECNTPKPESSATYCRKSYKAPDIYRWVYAKSKGYCDPSNVGDDHVVVSLQIACQRSDPGCQFVWQQLA